MLLLWFLLKGMDVWCFALDSLNSHIGLEGREIVFLLFGSLFLIDVFWCGSLFKEWFWGEVILFVTYFNILGMDLYQRVGIEESEGSKPRVKSPWDILSSKHLSIAILSTRVHSCPWSDPRSPSCWFHLLNGWLLQTDY